MFRHLRSQLKELHVILAYKKVYVSVFQFGESCSPDNDKVFRNTAIVHSGNAPAVYPRVHLSKVFNTYLIFHCELFPHNLFKIWGYNVKCFWKIYMDGWLWCNTSPWTKGVFDSALWECTLSILSVAFHVLGLMKCCFQTIPFNGTKLKHLAIQLNVTVNFVRKFEPDVIWLKSMRSLLECMQE